MTSLAFILGVMPLVFATRRRPGGAAFGRHRGRRRHARVDVPQPGVHSGAVCRGQEHHGAQTATWSSVRGGIGGRAACPSALRAMRSLLAGAALRAPPLDAQAPPPVERVTFQQAIERAISEQSVGGGRGRGDPARRGAAAAGARGDACCRSTATSTTTTLNTRRRVRGRDGDAAQPADRVADGRTCRFVARGARGRGARRPTDSAADRRVERRRHAPADRAGDRRRVPDASSRGGASSRPTSARATPRGRTSISRTELEQQGTGSRLNALRAQQQLSIDERLVEAAQLALYRAQEALGVLLVADGPVDAIDEPSFDLPPDAAARSRRRHGDLTPEPAAGPHRSEAVRRPAAGGRARAPRQLEGLAGRRSTRIFQPQSIYPAQFFSTANSWRFLLQANVPIFDSGQRAGREARSGRRRSTCREPT